MGKCLYGLLIKSIQLYINQKIQQRIEKGKRKKTTFSFFVFANQESIGELRSEEKRIDYSLKHIFSY